MNNELVNPSPETPSAHINLSHVGTSPVKILCNGKGIRIVLNQNTIVIGCTEITVEAVEYILRRHREVFSKPHSFVLQSC